MCSFLFCFIVVNFVKGFMTLERNVFLSWISSEPAGRPESLLNEPLYCNNISPPVFFQPSLSQHSASVCCSFIKLRAALRSGRASDPPGGVTARNAVSFLASTPGEPLRRSADSH